MEKPKTADPAAAKPKYINTYFHIDAGYVWGEGMDEKACRRFYDEIILLFVRSGWTVVPHEIGNTVDVVKGKSRLYVHPQELSGPCEESLIEKVKDILRQGKTFTLTRTDRYETLLDLDHDGLMDLYRKSNDKVDPLIIDKFLPYRPKSQRHVTMTLMKIGDIIKVNTLTDRLGRMSGDTTDRYLHERFDALVEAGKIKTTGQYAETVI